MKTSYILWLFIPLLWSCENDNSEYVNLPLDFKVPSNFPDVAYDIAANPPTEKGFELGKNCSTKAGWLPTDWFPVVFATYSKNAFTHHGHTVSHGVNNAAGTRNSPPIQNLAFQTAFMWDGATGHLDLQPIIPLTSPIEMNGDLNAILAMLKADPEYRKLFAQAFPDDGITSENMLKALSQFVVMAVSSNSRFDKYRRNEPGGTLMSDELAGYAVFNTKCASCHATDLMTDNSFRNNGLAVNPLVNDVGRYRVTEQADDYYKFKVPSLRNVEKTAPYMHDGRFGTLEAVLNHYASGITDSPTLDPLLRHNGSLGIPLTETEKAQVIAFLKTLTDDQYLIDKRFSEF